MILLWLFAAAPVLSLARHPALKRPTSALHPPRPPALLHVTGGADAWPDRPIDPRDRGQKSAQLSSPGVSALWAAIGDAARRGGVMGNMLALSFCDMLPMAPTQPMIVTAGAVLGFGK